MKRVSTTNCPMCLKGVAVHKGSAWLAFNHRRYARLRKQVNSVMPLASEADRKVTVDEALMDPTFRELVAPPKNDFNHKEKMYETFILAILELVWILLAVYGFRISETEWVILPLGMLMIYLLSKWSLESWLRKSREYHETWLCLQCGHQWQKKEASNRNPRITSSGS